MALSAIALIVHALKCSRSTESLSIDDSFCDFLGSGQCFLFRCLGCQDGFFFLTFPILICFCCFYKAEDGGPCQCVTGRSCVWPLVRACLPCNALSRLTSCASMSSVCALPLCFLPSLSSLSFSSVSSLSRCSCFVNPDNAAPTCLDASLLMSCSLLFLMGTYAGAESLSS